MSWMRAISLLILLPLVGLSWSCQGREDKPAPRTEAPPAAAPPTAAAPTTVPPGPATSAPAPAVGPSLAECCEVVVDSERKGRLGRLIVKFPDGFKAGNMELLPGTYDVVISGKRVEGVTIKSGHDTKVKVGVLRVNAGASTRIDLVEPAGDKNLQAETVTIQDAITNF